MIRLAESKDLRCIMPLFERARQTMREAGNDSQWINGYPSEELIAADIMNGNFYVDVNDGRITGGFAFIIGPEPTYGNIRGRWLNDDPYGTIHRLASSGEVKGLADRCFSFCRTVIANLRADTHEKNTLMQRLLLRNGFSYCGIINVADGSERLAYHLSSC